MLPALTIHVYATTGRQNYMTGLPLSFPLSSLHLADFDSRIGCVSGSARLVFTCLQRHYTLTLQDGIYARGTRSEAN